MYCLDDRSWQAVQIRLGLNGYRRYTYPEIGFVVGMNASRARIFVGRSLLKIERFHRIKFFAPPSPPSKARRLQQAKAKVRRLRRLYWEAEAVLESL